ncbi:unnamed protein product [Rhizophagus irregularis]|nr:unnamed protein product [Rhizophagus irregularis]
MHCLFLGIAKWIVTRLWIEEKKLTSENLSLMQERANKIQLPADIGRIPSRIATGDGFFGFTADQWKNFILIYATSIIWDLLKESDRRILANFVRACNILEIEKEYGPKKISPNLHLCLHICECSLDYGPLYAFWCYSMERMNGLLGSFHNSNRNIELELMKIIQRNALLDELTSHADQNSHIKESLEILRPRDSVRRGH